MADIEITMLIFSGRPNPKWIIGKDCHQFQDIIDEVQKHAAKRSLEMIPYGRKSSK